MVPDSAGNRLPGTSFKCRRRATEHRRFMDKVLGRYCKFNPRFPLRNSRSRNPHCHIHHHRTLQTSLAGIFFSFLIWSTAEAFGGVFTPGATDIGTAPPLHGHVRRAHSCSRRNATGGSYAALGHAKLNQLIYKSYKLVGLLPRVSSLQYTEKPHCPLACTPLYPLL